ncbi:uncharacterized protein NECHADRAFT_103191 [Fusarium vanettenii 77-13-4]|uniref:Spore coat protein SP96 n=1 Tax=Fusarium vanettenii (strain ATCC MYA-4622 / CBS 123669 / FGSC 9596 / NRRL 45880 / 77-13-4) TaxID=660122 RepID=C7YHZ7_FUSV7|nr:uncharacterized protein NECHADRAFT_103191 [Fusarium vanettenii 77-13-4]EEU48002.1 hypothetical protein NECHADRAFT_103191 [Fusarium vanettenii 77-13-4]
MKFFGIESAALALGLAGLAQAHMEMTSPPPFKSKANPHANGDVDYSMTAPLEAGGGNFPCKGYHSLFGTPAGASVADWKAGGSYSMTITGGANHGGGSCQASLSFDKGETWKVIHSYVGNCPGAGTTSYDFKVPADTPSGEAIFAWTWFNQIGNREMYMNCAAVTIGGGSSKKRASALSSRPSMFVANVNNGCSTEEGSDLEFPDPGPDTSNDSSKTAPPKGSCASSSGSGGGSSGGDSGATPSSPAGDVGSGNGNNGAVPSSPADNGSGAPSSAPVSAPTQTQPAAEPSQPAAEPTQPAVESSAPAGGAPSQVPGGVFITVSPPAEGTEAPVAAPTDTMMTLTKSAPGTGNEPMPTSVVQPEPVPTTPAGTPEAAPTVPATPSSGSGDGGSDSGSGSGEAHTAGTACTSEGEWNCIGGSKYQRCASGRWSVVQSMASGTTCSGSKAMAFAWGFGRKLALRARRA